MKQKQCDGCYAYTLDPETMKHCCCLGYKAVLVDGSSFPTEECPCPKDRKMFEKVLKKQHDQTA